MHTMIQDECFALKKLAGKLYSLARKLKFNCLKQKWNEKNETGTAVKKTKTKNPETEKKLTGKKC